MRKLLIKYEKNVRLIYKVILEKWNLKAKIIGMRTAARDKKKKRKQKKKNLSPCWALPAVERPRCCGSWADFWNRMRGP